MEDRSPTSIRAGRYITQPAGYRTFLPAPLPPDPPVRITGEMQALLSHADRSLGRLDGSIQTLPNPDLFVYMYVRKEAVLSSQIEGTQSSLQDLLAAEAKVFAKSSERRKRSGELCQSHESRLRRLSELPVSVRLIREIHTKLLQRRAGALISPPAGCEPARTGSGLLAARSRRPSLSRLNPTGRAGYVAIGTVYPPSTKDCLY